MTAFAEYKSEGTPLTAKPPRVWPAVALVIVLWLYHFISGRIELTMFEKFGTRVLVSGVVLILFLAWWLISRKVSWSQRLLVLGAAIAAELVGGKLRDRSMDPFSWALVTVPVVVTSWAVWWLIARRFVRIRAVGLVGVIFATIGVYALLRMDGLSGEQVLSLHWRWTPTAEQLFLASLNEKQPQTSLQFASTQLSTAGDDWPGFRGPARDSVVHNLRIDTDWTHNPPRLLWKHPIGPAWSSMTIIANRLFTQEQRGEMELVSCYDADRGSELWTHQDANRFMETISGPGPRATPTFWEGDLFTLGASGMLNRLDAASGKVKWSRNIAADAGAQVAMWGFASSPLVTHGLVIVYAGGHDKGLLAYRIDSADLAWAVPAGESSYTSAQLATIEGKEQVLCLNDYGLISVDPDSGAQLWKFDLVSKGAPRVIQPRAIAPGQVLIASETDLGTAVLNVARSGETWTVTRRWTSRALKPSFNDLVIQDGYAYGFDAAIFGCIDLNSGQRQWRTGRYGHGQVLLLADQKLLLITTEEGEVVLLDAKPDANHELARIPAVRGKTWNHPAIAHGMLYVRSDQEMACFELPIASGLTP